MRLIITIKEDVTDYDFAILISKIAANKPSFMPYKSGVGWVISESPKLVAYFDRRKRGQCSIPMDGWSYADASSLADLLNHNCSNKMHA